MNTNLVLREVTHRLLSHPACLAAAILVSLFTSNLRAAEAGKDSAELKVKWQVGKEYLQKIEMVQNQEISGASLPQTMKQLVTQIQQISLSVIKQRSGGGVELEMKILGQQFETKQGDRTIMKFDSASKQEDDAPTAAMFRKLIGAKITFLTDGNGMIEKVENFDAFMNQVMAGSPPELQGILTNMLSENTLKQMGMTSQGIPGKTVKIGDSWPQVIDMPMGPMGTLKLDMKYTFKGWENQDGKRTALLEHSGTVTSKKSSENSSMSMTIEDGKTSGKVWFDPVLGMVLKADARQDMNMKMTMQGQDMLIKIKQTVVNTLVSVKDIAK